MTSPTIYGFASEPWTLPEHLVRCREAVLAWRDWEFRPSDLPWVFLSFYPWTSDLLHHGVRMMLTYASDPDNEDRWQHPESLLCSPSDSYLRGDCEDFALCFAGLAHRALGIDPEDIFINVMHLPREDEPVWYEGRPVTYNNGNQVVKPMIHAVCVIRTDEGNKVLDQRAIEVLDDTPDADIAPIFSINLNGESFLHGRPA